MGRRMDCAEGPEAQWMVFGDRTTRLRIRHNRRIRQFSEFREFLASLCEPYSSSGEDRRTLRLAEPLKRLRECLAARTGGRLRTIILRKHDFFFLGARKE